MSHPSIQSAVVRERLEELTDARLADLAGLESMVGDGTPAELGELTRAAQEIREALDARLRDGDGGMDDDQFEGAMAARLHRALCSLEVDVLDDPGFWAYIACVPLWFFTKWREDPASRNPETYHVYADGTKADACVPLRMFLRAQAIELDGDYSLAPAIPSGTDFWRSHVLRVRTGGKKELARAIAVEQRDRRMTVDPLRQYAKRVNRRWSNQVIYVLAQEDCDEIAKSERP